MEREASRRITRRRAIALFTGGAAGALLLACSPRGGAQQEAETSSEAVSPDLVARFSAYEPATEPNGDVTKVVWPDFVTRAGPEVQRLYEFQIENGDLMRYMPCFCGCGSNDHKSNRDCYVREVQADGTVVLDAMAPVCDVCMGVTRSVMEMKEQGITPRAMRARIDSMYASQIEFSTPTPYPPA